MDSRYVGEPSGSMFRVSPPLRSYLWNTPGSHPRVSSERPDRLTPPSVLSHYRSESSPEVFGSVTSPFKGRDRSNRELPFHRGHGVVCKVSVEGLVSSRSDRSWRRGLLRVLESLGLIPVLLFSTFDEGPTTWVCIVYVCVRRCVPRVCGFCTYTRLCIPVCRVCLCFFRSTYVYTHTCVCRCVDDRSGSGHMWGSLCLLTRGRVCASSSVSSFLNLTRLSCVAGGPSGL